MFKWMTGKTRSRFVAPGIVALLFVAGLAFSVFENTSLPRLMSSIGIGEEDQVIAAPTDPRMDPYDCLYDPEALRDLVAVPHSSGGTEGTDPALPVSRPGTNAASPGVAGDDGGTESAVMPGGSPTSSDSSPSNGTIDGDGDAPDGDTPGTSPHERNHESPCPGL
jgi:hypothetical protein